MSFKTVHLGVHGIVVRVDESPGGGNIVCSDDCYETCPKCGQRDCLYQCEGSHLGEVESEETVSCRHQHNGAVDAICSVILAHACAGVWIESGEYLEGIRTAFNAVGENT